MGEKSTQLYTMADQLCRRSERVMVMATVDDKEEEDDDIDADYIVDEKARTATLTARGINKAEKASSMWRTWPTRRTPPSPTTSTRPSRPAAS